MAANPNDAVAVIRPINGDANGQWSMSDADARSLGAGLGQWLNDAAAAGPSTPGVESGDSWAGDNEAASSGDGWQEGVEYEY